MLEETGEMPPALANKPDLDPIWTWPHMVWKELSGGRQYLEDTPRQLSFSEVAVYGLVHGCSRLELVSLWGDLHKIDNAWLSEVAKMQEGQAS